MFIIALVLDTFLPLTLHKHDLYMLTNMNVRLKLSKIRVIFLTKRTSGYIFGVFIYQTRSRIYFLKHESEKHFFGRSRNIPQIHLIQYTTHYNAIRMLSDNNRMATATRHLKFNSISLRLFNRVLLFICFSFF